jgi:pyruvyl transferase EpsO
MDRSSLQAPQRGHSRESGHAVLMHALAGRHAAIAELIGERPFHYVDIPVHGNIGDLLILHGTLAFFERYRLTPRIAAPALSYRPQWLKRGEAVVFHGGGNFGDLYDEYGMHALREAVVANCPENRIVIMPQSIHFTNRERCERSARLFRRHPDVHIVVRDVPSFRIAQEFSEHVYLLPDMAHQLYPLAAEGGKTGGTLMISRMDDEKIHAGCAAGLAVAVTTDWPVVVGDKEHRIDRYRRAMHGMNRLGLGWIGNRLLFAQWTAFSGRLIDDAVRLFSAHDRIVTDRLHGHILACLMNKPSIVLDNSYGKNSRYVGAWTADSALVSLMTA